MTGTDIKDRGFGVPCDIFHGSYFFSVVWAWDYTLLSCPSGHLEFRRDEGYLDNYKRNKMGIKRKSS